MPSLNTKISKSPFKFVTQFFLMFWKKVTHQSFGEKFSYLDKVGKEAMPQLQ